MAYDVITIGAATRDVFLVSKEIKLVKSPKFSTGIGECVSFGTKIDVDTFVSTTGGGATNAAATFSNLGFKAAVVSRVGDDRVGKSVLEELEDAGIDTSLVKRVKGGETGYSTLLTAPNGERTVLVYRGVSSKFETKDIPLKSCTAKWYYLSSLGGNLDLSKRIILHAATCGSRVAWNPGSKEIAKGLSSLKDYLKHVSVLNMNKEEAQKLTRQKTIERMFAKLASKGTIVIITDGTEGAYAHRDGKTVWSGTTDAKAISRTGAGDAFGSGFVSALMKKNDLAYALAVGTLNAESVIQSFGAKDGILSKWPGTKAIKSIPVKSL